MGEWKTIDSAPTEHLADMLLWDPLEQVALPALRFNDRIGCEIRLVARYDDKKTVGRCTHWHPPLPPPPKD